MKFLFKWLGLGLGAGLIPKAPGIAGSLLALFLAFFFNIVHNPYFLILSIFLGIWICEISERELGKKDDNRIVLDEIIGQWVAIAGFSGYYLILGFFLFRFFDTVKPPPIRQLQKCHGGIGIILDDLLAGGIVWVLLNLLRNIF